jgi:hypothetical protein
MQLKTAGRLRDVDPLATLAVLGMPSGCLAGSGRRAAHGRGSGGASQPAALDGLLRPTDKGRTKRLAPMKPARAGYRALPKSSVEVGVRLT